MHPRSAMAGTGTMSLELVDLHDAQDAHDAQEVAPPPIPRRIRRRRKATLQPGCRVGAWRVDGELGRGGMGSVYAVTHNGFGKRAALKLCHRSVLGTEFTASTFLREARIVHLVDHPGVPDVFATGTYDGRPYLAMERLSGETLGTLADRGPLAKPEAIELVLEICDVLRTAHAAGVIHRDLKLDNVFVLDRPGAGGRRTKLLDWGVARIVGEDDPMRGMIAGTLTYVAPEQVRGDEITAAADIYSLGVVAYELLLNRRPFDSRSDLELVQKHLREAPPAPASVWPAIPAELARLLTAMLAKDPARRPSLDEVIAGLRAAHAALQPRTRAWRERARDALRVPAAPPVDVLGRSALVLGARQRMLGATLGLAALIASAAALLTS